MTENHPSSECQILLVEDNPGDALLVETLLEEITDTRFHVHHEPRLDHALTYLKENAVDCVLLDLSLPDSEGLPSVQVIHNSAPATPIVVLSGNTDQRLALEAVKYGAQDFLVKGSGGSELMARAIHYAIERVRSEQRLTWLAHHDNLTGLANRPRFREALALAIARADRSGEMFAVLFLDLDRFKIINDTCGHDAGDDLLVSVSHRLAGCVRLTDTVARLGGDEFAILLEGKQSFNDLMACAGKILRVIEPPFTIGTQEFRISTSIGIATYPRCGREAEVLLRNADAAMYRAKQSGRGTYRFFTDDMHEQTRKRLHLERDLHNAVQREQFKLFYQPVLDIESQRTVGVEALLRWDRRGDGVMVSPMDFIPLSEETGLIVAIGEWVLYEACRQWSEWRTSGMRPLRMAVNLSPRQFRQKDLIKMVRRVVEETRMDPSYLQFELTEGVLMEDTVEASYVLNELKAMQIGISIDDFGTGYSSLSNLKNFPVDTLKIDRSFIRDITSGPDDAAIAGAIIAMAHSLGKHVVAEGVETAEQLDILKAMGCEAIQGYFYSPPRPAEELVPIISGRPRLAVG